MVTILDPFCSLQRVEISGCHRSTVNRAPHLGSRLDPPLGYRCFIKNNKDHLSKFQRKCDESLFLGYSTRGITYKVLNRRTRSIEEIFDVTFDDLFVRNSSKNHVITHIMENDTPSSGGPIQQIVVHIDFDSLFGPPGVVLDADVLRTTEALVSANSS